MRRFSQVFTSDECIFGYLFNDLGERYFGIKGVEDKQVNIQRFKDSCDFSVMKSYLLQNEMIGNKTEYPVGIRDYQITDEINQFRVYKDYLDNLFNSLDEHSKNGCTNALDFIKSLQQNLNNIKGGLNEKNKITLEELHKDTTVNNQNLSHSGENIAKGV